MNKKVSGDGKYPQLGSSDFVEEPASLVNYQSYLKSLWSDGTTQVLLSGVELIEKLAAAVPPPRGHLIRYVGILAPNSKLRSMIVLKPKPKARDESGKMRPAATARVSWAELMKHSFEFDLTRCIACGGAVKVIAVIANPMLAAAIIRNLARPPPEVVNS